MNRDRIDAILPAFEGVGIAFTNRLAWALEEDALGPLLMADDFESIARRIHHLSTVALDAGSHWAGGVQAVDTGVPTVDPLDALRAALDELEVGHNSQEDGEADMDFGYVQAIEDVRDAIKALSA